MPCRSTIELRNMKIEARSMRHYETNSGNRQQVSGSLHARYSSAIITTITLAGYSNSVYASVRAGQPECCQSWYEKKTPQIAY